MNAAIQNKLSLAVFGAALRKAREENGLSVAGLTKGIKGANRELIESWEAGHAVPSTVQLKGYLAMSPWLKRYESDIRSGNYVAVERQPVAKDATPRWLEQRMSAMVAVVAPPRSEPPPVDRAKTFGAALAAAREAAGMTQAAIGELCGVTGPAVGHWEQNLWAPVLENYEKLLALFPELADAPDPNSRDIDKPIGPLGLERTVIRRVELSPRVESDAPAASPMEAVDSSPMPSAAPPATFEPSPPAEPEPMPEPTPQTPPVALPAIVRWTKATSRLALDRAQAEALSELLAAGAALGLGVEDLGKVLMEWPQRANAATRGA